jgi:hypothetical protein
MTFDINGIIINTNDMQKHTNDNINHINDICFDVQSLDNELQNLKFLQFNLCENEFLLFVYSINVKQTQSKLLFRSSISSPDVVLFLIISIKIDGLLLNSD